MPKVIILLMITDLCDLRNKKIIIFWVFILCNNLDRTSNVDYLPLIEEEIVCYKQPSRYSVDCILRFSFHLDIDFDAESVHFAISLLHVAGRPSFHSIH